MDVFISWSGKRSHAVAQVLRDWLPMLINALKPWLSSTDIDKGARWNAELAQQLQNAKAGIICLNPSNLHADWILFEAGALAKTVQNPYVCTFLDNLKPSDVGWPLAQFQSTQINKDDLFKLLKSLNSALGDEALEVKHIEKAFEIWWPKLESDLKKLPVEEASASPQRSERELLEEILSTVRNQTRPTGLSAIQARRATVLAEVHKAIDQLLPLAGIQSTSSTIHGSDYVCEALSKNGDKIRVVVPVDVDLGEVEAKVRSQLAGPAKSATLEFLPPTTN